MTTSPATKPASKKAPPKPQKRTTLKAGPEGKRTLRLGQEFYRAATLNDEDDGDKFHGTEMEVWVIATLGTKYITLYNRNEFTWVKKKGAYQWDKNISSVWTKQIPIDTFPAASRFSSTPEVYGTQQQAMEAEIKSCRDDLVRYGDDPDITKFSTDAIAAWERRLKGFKTKRKNAKEKTAKAKTEVPAG